MIGAISAVGNSLSPGSSADGRRWKLSKEWSGM
jgi:hypothetical protein